MDSKNVCVEVSSFVSVKLGTYKVEVKCEQLLELGISRAELVVGDPGAHA